MTTTPITERSARLVALSLSISTSLVISPFTTVTDTTTGPLFFITTHISQSSDTSAPEVPVRGVPRRPEAGRC